MSKFGEWLLEKELISPEQLSLALNRQKKLGEHKMIGQILVDMKILSMDELIKYSRDHIEAKLKV